MPIIPFKNIKFTSDRPDRLSTRGQFVMFLAFIVVILGLTACSGLAGRTEAQSNAMQAESAGASAIPGLIDRLGHTDFRLPEQVTLCGEAFDLKRAAVAERLEFEFIRVVNHPAQVALWQRRAALYFPLIEAELRAAGLPDDLKYLAVAESDLRPWIVSPAGALGLWQFMPATAKAFGLTVSPKIDQRQLPEPLLGAAQRYFKSLHNKFGNWALAMAAYNAGEGRIARAMTTQGIDNYFDLDLPRETERYVYRIAAIKVVMENATHYGLKSSLPAKFYETESYVERNVDIPKGRTWPQLAKQLGCDYKTLRTLNPHITQASLAGPYTLRVPVSAANKPIQ